MLYNSIINYKSYNKQNFCFFFLINIKKIKNLKIKKKIKTMLNIKQIILIMFITNFWKKINFNNLCLIITIKKNNILSNMDGIHKLFLISKGYFKCNLVNLNNIFVELINLVWTNIGFYTLKQFKKINFYSNIIIESIDKIPYLTKFVVPLNVRISNTNRVRLGSYLSKGTTIMSEGYVNFNTYIGLNCMIEGRISSGVYISEKTDIGGSASIMGTLSGGGNNIISVGKKCLLGANSGLGISLGNNCIIEAGLYVTSGTKVCLIINNNFIIIKAKKLSFLNDLIFYRNSLNGIIECCKNFTNLTKINSILHKN